MAIGKMHDGCRLAHLACTLDDEGHSVSTKFHNPYLVYIYDKGAGSPRNQDGGQRLYCAYDLVVFILHIEQDPSGIRPRDDRC